MKQKNIYIDVTQAYHWQGRSAGIIRVMDELSMRFIDDARFNTNFVVWDSERMYFYEVDFKEVVDKRKLQEDSVKDIVYKEPFIRRLRRRIYSSRSDFKEQCVFEEKSILFMPHGGVWESAQYIKYVLNDLQSERKMKLAMIIYDLCPIVTPQYCSEGIQNIYRNFMSKVMHRSDLILSISQNTKKDVSDWLMSREKKPKLSLVYRNGDELKAKGKKPTRLAVSNQKYIVCIGTVEARKNHTLLYYAYKLAEERGINLPPTLIIGRKGWLADDIYRVITNDKSIFNKKIFFLHNTSDEEMIWLIKNSQFSVYPSFYEGWGLPIAESLTLGVPVLSSNTSSMPEIGEEMVDYFSPYSPEDLLSAMDKLLSSENYFNKKREKIKEHYKVTSWSDSYRTVSDIIYNNL